MIGLTNFDTQWLKMAPEFVETFQVQQLFRPRILSCKSNDLNKILNSLPKNNFTSKIHPKNARQKEKALGWNSIQEEQKNKEAVLLYYDYPNQNEQMIMTNRSRYEHPGPQCMTAGGTRQNDKPSHRLLDWLKQMLRRSFLSSPQCSSVFVCRRNSWRHLTK